MIKAAVLILNYNGRSHLENFLSGIQKHSAPYRVVVGDNASTDDSLEYLHKNHPDVEVLPLGENYGYAGGYNRLIREVDSEYLVIMNSDIRCDSDWLPPLVGYLDNNPDCAAVQPKIRSNSKPEYFEYAGASGGFLDKLGYPFCRGRVFETLEKDHGQYDNTMNVFWASGACFVIRKSVFEEAGGFDEDFFAHMEEIDLCWRLHKMGHDVAVVPESLVYHVGGGTLDYSSPFKTFLNFRNGLYLLAKNLPEDKVNKIIAQRLRLDRLSTIYFIMKGRFAQARAVLKAHREFKRNRQEMLSRNKSFSERYNEPTSRYLYDFSVVSEYFLKGKKTFQKLVPNGTSPS